MPKKPASMYRNPVGQPYGRIEYIKSIPVSRITRAHMGKPNNERFDVQILGIIDKNVQIRDICMEAVRISLSRSLLKAVGKDQFWSMFRKMPYLIIRENKMATGAGADRLSSGMRAAFGKTVGRACRFKKNDVFIEVHVSKENSASVRQIVKKLGTKLSCSLKVQVNPISKRSK